jgi:hypothetical protein
MTGTPAASTATITSLHIIFKIRDTMLSPCLDLPTVKTNIKFQMPNLKTVAELCLIYLGNSRQFTNITDYPENTPSNPNGRLINNLCILQIMK